MLDVINRKALFKHVVLGFTACNKLTKLITAQMNRFLFIMTAGCLLLRSARCEAVEPGLTVSIAISQTRNGVAGVRSWKKGSRSSHVQVVFTNETSKPVLIWKETNLWGYNALRFEATDEHGKLFSVERAMTGSSGDIPTTWSVKAMQSLVMDIPLRNRAVSEDRLLFGLGHRITLEAIYDVRPDIWSSKFNVWTGHIISKPVVCIIY
jgi:hypothetical protein